MTGDVGRPGKDGHRRRSSKVSIPYPIPSKIGVGKTTEGRRRRSPRITANRGGKQRPGDRSKIRYTDVKIKPDKLGKKH